MLELFSGTGSFGKVGKERGYNVVSVDIDDYNGRFVPTHKADILTWDYKQYDRDFFDVIHASPPCLHYSILQTAWYGREKRDLITKELYTFTKEIRFANLLQADLIVNRTLEIISYFNPRLWFLENPQTGLLKSRDFMMGLPYYDIDYCMYSDWGYRKRTRIWTNKKDFIGKLCNKECGNMIDNKHKAGVEKDFHKMDRYRIPPTLIHDLLD